MEIRIQVTGAPKYKVMKNIIRQSDCRMTFYNQAEGIYYLTTLKATNLIKLGARLQFENINFII